MSRLWVVMLLTASIPASAQWLPEPGANPPFVSTPGDVTSGGVVSGAEGEFQFLSNPDGGTVYLPQGLAVDPGSVVCLNAPACTVRAYASGNTIVLLAPAGTSITNGLTAQGVIEGGSLQANSVELVGGATSATVRAASGTGATPDAGLYLLPGAPNGPLVAPYASGVWTPRVRAVDGGVPEFTPGFSMPIALAPVDVFGPASPRAFYNQVVRVRPDGGLETQFVGWDGEDWYTARPSEDYPVTVPVNAGQGVYFLSVPPEASTGAITMMTWTAQATGGTGTTEMLVQQRLPDGGLNILCKLSPLPCDPVANDTRQVYCPENRWYRGPDDAGIAQNIVAVWDGGCAGGGAQTPGGALLVRTRVGLCVPGQVAGCQ